MAEFINGTDEPVDDRQAALYWQNRWASLAASMTDTLTTHDRIFAAVHDLLWKATQFGTTEDGDTYAYIIPKGSVHRLVGAMVSAGKTAALRDHNFPEPDLDTGLQNPGEQHG